MTATCEFCGAEREGVWTEAYVELAIDRGEKYANGIPHWRERSFGLCRDCHDKVWTMLAAMTLPRFRPADVSAIC